MKDREIVGLLVINKMKDFNRKALVKQSLCDRNINLKIKLFTTFVNNYRFHDFKHSMIFTFLTNEGKKYSNSMQKTSKSFYIVLIHISTSFLTKKIILKEKAKT